MRLLFMTDAFLPHAGGARVYYYNLFRELARNSPTETTILTKKVPGWKAFDQAESRHGFRIVRCGRPLPHWKYQQLPKIVIPLLRAAPLLAWGGFDLIHFGDLYPQGVLSLGFKRLFKMPYVAYCHGEEITQIDGRRFQPKVRDAIYQGADMVVAASEFARQNLLRIGIPNDKIQKITPGVDYGRFQGAKPRPDLVERYQLQGKKVLLTVARLVPRKGHATVMRAVAKLLQEVPNLTYLIVGKGPEEQRLRQMARELNLGDSVQFAGFIKDEDLPAFYHLADIYVMPNSEEKGDMEGFGMVFLEANACAKPVIAGRSGGTAEAVVEGTTGMLVDPHSPDELADTLRLLLRNTELASQLGRQGQRRAQSEFNWSSRARMLDEVNHLICSKRNHAFVMTRPDQSKLLSESKARE